MAKFIEEEGIILTQEEKENIKEATQHVSRQKLTTPEMAKYFLSFGFRDK